MSGRYRLTVRTTAFQAVNRGSIPRSATTLVPGNNFYQLHRLAASESESDFN